MKSGRFAEFAESLGPLRQFTDHRQFLEGVSDLLGGESAPGLAIGNVVHEPGSSPELASGTDLEVIRDATAPSDEGAVTDTRASGDSGETADDHATPDSTVVSDLAEIVDLAAVADDRGAELSPVDAGVGSDLDVSPDLHVTEMGDLLQAASIRGRSVPESVAADHHSGMKDRVFTDEAAFPNHDLGMNEGSGGHDHVGVNATPGFQRDAGADGRPRADHHPGADRGVVRDRRGGIDRRARMDARFRTVRQFAAGVLEELKDDDHRLVGIVDPDHGSSGGVPFSEIEPSIDEGHRGLGCRPSSSMPGVTDEGEVAGAGVTEGLDAVDLEACVPFKITPHESREVCGGRGGASLGQSGDVQPAFPFMRSSMRSVMSKEFVA